MVETARFETTAFSLNELYISMKTMQ